MKIIGFAGSSSTKSINKRLVKYTLSLMGDVEYELLDLNDFEMPLYSIDREKENGIPNKARAFREKMSDADGIVCSMAEHNRNYTVAFKNILDWCSRIDLKIFASKPMLLMSTSPGGYGGGNVMKAAHSFFPDCGAEIIETFSLPSFNKNFTDEQIADEALQKEHLAKVKSFLEALK